jgi:putative ATP-dependent endonuclease of OLD family
MRLKSLHIKNYRSLKDAAIEFDPYTCLIGANGAGKSTVLCALNVLFREPVAGIDPGGLQLEDFHGKNAGRPIEITATFGDLSGDAKEDFAAYVRNGILMISAVATWDPGSATARVVQYGERMVFVPFARFFEAEKEKVSVADLRSIYDEMRAEYLELPPPGNKEAMMRSLREYEAARPQQLQAVRSEDQFYGISKGENRLARHIQWVYVPAVKDASAEQSESRNSALGKLLARAVRRRVKFDDHVKRIAESARREYQALLEEHQGALDEVSRSLADGLAQWAHPLTGLAVRWQQDPKKSVQVEEPVAGVVAREGDFEGQISRFGHGFQRSFLLALLSELAKGDEGPTLLLGCEEPELYQHPPQARHLAHVLRKLSEGNAQAIVTTHSPWFVSGEAFEEVRLLRRAAGGMHSEAHRMRFDDLAAAHQAATGKARLKPAGAMATIHQALLTSIAEMFFASRLVLVEGLEDVAFLNSWLALTGRWDEVRKRGIQIVPTHGKGHMLVPLLIAQGLQVPHFAMFDCDGHDEKHRPEHLADNTALLVALGGNRDAAFPEAPIWAATFTAWPKTLEMSVEGDVDPQDWTRAKEYASAECGHARSMGKNTLHIGARLAYLWDRGVRPATLEQVCSAFLAF